MVVDSVWFTLLNGFCIFPEPTSNLIFYNWDQIDCLHIHTTDAIAFFHNLGILISSSIYQAWWGAFLNSLWRVRGFPLGDYWIYMSSLITYRDHFYGAYRLSSSYSSRFQGCCSFFPFFFCVNVCRRNLNNYALVCLELLWSFSDMVNCSIGYILSTISLY